MDEDLKPLGYISDDEEFNLSEKTVFVLDGADYFTNVGSGHSCHADHLRESKKAGTVGIHPIEPVPKSIWTCSIEAVAEYSRIVWDLFPKGKRVISIMISCPEQAPDNVHRITGWNEEHQNLHHLMKSLAISNSKRLKTTNLTICNDISRYPNSNGLNLVPALERAIDQMVEPTNAQKQSKSKVPNLGRIILVSSFQSQESVNQLISHYFWLIETKRHSKVLIRYESKQGVINSATTSCDIDRIELLIINTFPINDNGTTPQIVDLGPQWRFSEYGIVKLSSVASGRNIAGMLSNYCLQHYRLRSTTITGIPMKEEQNASSSSNYDVELMHCSSAHDDLTTGGNPLFDGVVNIKHRHGYPYESYTLRWCTPRSNNVELFHCTHTSRITSVDVNSRPSSCLTNFLLNGRAVMLEIYKSKNSRMTSHMLASHSGELYIHTLATNKLNLEDSLSIVECTGGRVTDYRVKEFSNFVKKHTLRPCRILENDTADTTNPLNRALAKLDRSTLYWPLVSSHTIMFNLVHKVSKIVELIPKSKLTMNEVLELKKNIFDVVSMENDYANIPPPQIGLKSPSGSKSQKIDQNYKLLWNELENFLRVHSATPEHEMVLECLIECRSYDTKKSTDVKKAGTSARKSVKSKRSIDEPKSPPAKRAKNDSMLIVDPGQNVDPQVLVNFKSGLSLLQTWTALRALNRPPQSAPRPEFAGRLNGSNICPLYPHLDLNAQGTANNAQDKVR